MPIVGCGIDIVNLQRIYSLLGKFPARRLLLKISSNPEIAAYRTSFPDHYENPFEDTNYYEANVTSKRAVMFIAKLWSIKESTYKAVFPFITLGWKDIIVGTNQGKPTLAFNDAVHTRLFAKYGALRPHVPLSHDGCYFISQVLVEHLY